MSQQIFDKLKSNDPEIKQSKLLKSLESDDMANHFDDPLDNEMVMNMGPQHPATHGVLRLLLRLDGETVVKALTEIGYLHRGYEKIAESCNYHEFIPHTDRLDYLQPVANNVGYTLAVEKLLGIEITERCKYIRTICCELGRLESHLVAVGSMVMDLGAITPFIWTFREREKIQDILDIVTGVRFTTSYTRIGGVAQDITPEAIAAIKKFIDEFPGNLKDTRAILDRNRIFIERTQGIGYMSKEDLLQWGASGPVLRAGGVERDLRKDDPYLIYDKVDFRVPVYTDSDVLARYYVRIEEMLESVKILRQCIEKIPEGPVRTIEPKQVLPGKQKIYTKMEELIYDFMLINFGITPPVGEAYQGIESSKGELGFYLISDGSGHPFRLKIRSPSFTNIQTIPVMLHNCMISDIVAILGSLDPVMGEADK